MLEPSREVGEISKRRRKKREKGPGFAAVGFAATAQSCGFPVSFSGNVSLPLSVGGLESAKRI